MKQTKNGFSWVNCIRLQKTLLITLILGISLLNDAKASENLAFSDTNLLKEKTIKGQIVDKKGSPIPGASIYVKGASQNGTDSNIDGKFSLKVKLNDIIVISSLGFKEQKVKITKRNFYKIVLEEDREQLDEVVVTGYQKVSKQRMTGSVQALKAEKLEDKGYINVTDALKGQITGLASIQLSGRPGAASQIRIRGINTLSGNANPIWIVDGMPMQGNLPKLGVGGSDFTNSVLTNGIGNIPVEDIASITVLKDAAASAIYGSRAANGVIVVTTKRGSEGKSYINYSSTFSIDEAPQSNIEMMNSEQKIRFEQQLYNDYSHLNLEGRVFQLLKKRDGGFISEAEYKKELNRLKGINTNWFNELFRKAYTQNHFISLQGGSKATRFYGSLNYQNQDGTLKGNNYSKYGASVKITHDFNKKLRINLDGSFNYKTESTTASRINPIQYAYYANRYESIYDSKGNLAFDRTYDSELSNIGDSYKYDLNILDDILNNKSKNNYLNSTINAKLEYEIISGLMFTSQGAFSSTYGNSKTVYSPGSYTSERNSWASSFYPNGEIPNSLNNGKLQETNSHSLSYTWRNLLSYNKYFMTRHFINVMVGQEMSNSDSNSFGVSSPEYDPTYGLVGVPNLNNIDGSKINVSSLSSTSTSRRRTVSFFGNATYSYMNKYVFSASGRFDGVDIVGTNNRFTPLWNTSFKYNISKEKYMEDLYWINQLSIRASYGFTGSIDYGAYPFPILHYSDFSRKYNNKLIPSSITPANPSIKWQRKTDISFGLDFALFDNRFSGTINYYTNTTKDLLDDMNLPISTGKLKVKANVASVRNEGLELSFNTVNIKTEDFRWTTNFNISLNRNNVISTYIKNLDEIPSIGKGYGKKFVQGYSVSSIFGYKFAGIDPNNGHMLAYIDKIDDQGKRIGHKTKDGKYVIDMDTEYNKGAITYLGKNHPPITGGFGTSIIYKRFNLNAIFNYSYGHKIKSFNANSTFPLRNSKLNVTVDQFDRWRNSGDNVKIPVYSDSNTSAYNQYLFDSNLEDGNYLRLSNISLMYNLSQELCNKFKINKLSFGISISNLYTWTKYKGIDPETLGAFGYPSTRRYSLTFKIGI
ncbi:MAG: SusC/RagA family TonB-linked outer membrane protein [Marinifilaceae bacterium]|jgi:TonB-linked SusC/RagA family outer membrane protein|nr:SusC/RagA family TonB-linked outer membrane protein [Marinifilaceae bacterium]